MAEVGRTLLSGLAGRRSSFGLPVGQECPTYLTGVHECVATSDGVGIGVTAHPADRGTLFVARENLQLMLFLNLSQLAGMFPRLPDK